MCGRAALLSLKTGPMQFLPPLYYVGVCYWHSAEGALILLLACSQGYVVGMMSSSDALAIPTPSSPTPGLGLRGCG